MFLLLVMFLLLTDITVIKFEWYLLDINFHIYIKLHSHINNNLSTLYVTGLSAASTFVIPQPFHSCILR